MKVNNIPAYAKDYNYIVARNVDGELWFWGAYHDYGTAVDIVNANEDMILV